MKKIILTFVVFVITFIGSSQVIPPICGGPFIDNGGVTGDYLPSTNQTTIICPDAPNVVITVTFTSFDLEAQHDGMYVYDGDFLNQNNQIASSNSGGAYWGNTIPGPFISSIPGGCLTFVFTSDDTIQNSGWIANVTCAPLTTGFELIPFLDINNNGNQDIGEINFPLGTFQYQKNGGNSNYLYTPNEIGYLVENNPVNIYNFNYNINPTYSALFYDTVPNYTNVTIGATPGLVTLNFPITASSYFTDLGVNVFNYNLAPRAGNDYLCLLSYTNYGNVPIANGSLTFTNDPATTIVATSQIVNTIPTGFTYDFTNLYPFETRYIYVTIAVPSIPIVSLGQLLTNTANIITSATETTLTNNTCSNTEAIVASWDPNDITELHGEKIVYSTFAPDEYLTYTIRFENTGTAPAENVRVTDILDVKIDETSVQMVSSSNSYVLNRIDNNLSWELNNIQLPVSVPNTTIGKGYITFKAKLKPGFSIGTTVPNMAKIYFDTNPAIDTNTFTTEFVTTLSNVNFDFDNSVSIFPNPTKNNININSKFDIKSVQLFDIQGRILTTKLVEGYQANLDISSYSNGVYFIKITSISGSKIEKLVKE